MASKESFTIKHVEGQFLFRYASSAGLPAKFGDESFDLATQVLSDDQTRILRRDLRAYSPILQKYQKPCFGDSDNWKRNETEGGDVWTMIDTDRPITISLEDDSISGVYWCLFRAIHPSSPHKSTLAEIDEIVWVLAETFGWTEELQKAIKLNVKKGLILTRKK
jgi:hypothetical protein